LTTNGLGALFSRVPARRPPKNEARCCASIRKAGASPCTQARKNGAKFIPREVERAVLEILSRIELMSVNGYTAETTRRAIAVAPIEGSRLSQRSRGLNKLSGRRGH